MAPWGEVALLLASWGCVAGGVRAADASSPQPWRNQLCSWPVMPRILQGTRSVGLKAAALGPTSFPAKLQLALEVEGETLLLDLGQNRELVKGTPGLLYYLPNGTRTLQPTNPESNCCYRGTIQGYLNSWASVCVCSGLSGLLTVSRFRSYSLESTPDGDTRAYRLETLKTSTGACRPSRQFHPQPKRTPLHRAKREAETERGYVELVIVADQAEFQLDPNISRIQTRIVEIASHMDGFYRTLGLRVALVGAEIWNQRNRVSTEGAAGEVLTRFLAWKEKDLLPRIPHDSVQLIIGPPFTAGVIGASTQGSICTKRSGGISMGHSVSPLIMASTLSHQLGHNLGLVHDVVGCSCNSSIRAPGRKCIMEPPTGIMPGLSFSTCSQQRVQRILRSDRIGCLLDRPKPDRLVKSLCGNRFVEYGEQCDCGLFLECTDPCCNATSCQLMPGAQCATGDPCCHQCKLRSAGHVCRVAQNECDLPEFCDGASPRCPSNVYKQDGTLCEGGKAVCYGGICPTYLSQCQGLWGPDAVPLSDGCVASLNPRGDARGNCGQNPNGSYISCAKRQAVPLLPTTVGPPISESALLVNSLPPHFRGWCRAKQKKIQNCKQRSQNGRLSNSDVRCGQLQCEKKRNGAFRTPNCLRDALTIAVAADVLNEAVALSGTNCGSSKVCIDKRCQDLSSLKFPECKCGGRGICNSKGHCHCQPGWAPPDCQSGGLGGSVDSGPPAPEEASRSTSTVLILIALLLVALLVAGLCCAKRLGLYKRLCQFGKGTSCQYRADPESRVEFLHPAGRITQPEPRSYSKTPPNRPRPPQWKPSTELQLMPTSKQPVALGAARPDPPSKPLPPDPIPKDQQASAGDRPAPPIRPLPPDPIAKTQVIVSPFPRGGERTPGRRGTPFAEGKAIGKASPAPPKPPPPQKPLPSDPPRPQLGAGPSCDPEVQMLPSSCERGGEAGAWLRRCFFSPPAAAPATADAEPLVGAMRPVGALRALPWGLFLLWGALLGRQVRGLRHAVHWNASNPRFFDSDGGYAIQVSINDYLDIYCPHYERPLAAGNPEAFALFMVDAEGYRECYETPGAFKRWECNRPYAPYGPVRFSEKIQRFTPFSLGFEFQGGREYYYISVPLSESPGQCLKLRVFVCCKATTTTDPVTEAPKSQPRGRGGPEKAVVVRGHGSAPMQLGVACLALVVLPFLWL
ncbi:disintegrin and metalloproteinase domain-containing protein 15 [Liasis olivaceus]